MNQIRFTVFSVLTGNVTCVWQETFVGDSHPLLISSNPSVVLQICEEFPGGITYWDYARHQFVVVNHNPHVSLNGNSTVIGFGNWEII